MARKVSKTIHEIDEEIWTQARVEAIKDGVKIANWLESAIVFYKSRVLRLDLVDKILDKK
jgi:hypothetical protein